MSHTARLQNALASFQTEVDKILNLLCSENGTMPLDSVRDIHARLDLVKTQVATISNATNSRAPHELICEIMDTALRYNMRHDERIALYNTLSLTCWQWRRLVDDAMPLPICVDRGSDLSMCWAVSRLRNSKLTKVVWLHWAPVTSWGVNDTSSTIGDDLAVAGDGQPLNHRVGFREPDVQALVNLLVERKSRLEAVDLLTGVELLVGWERIIAGDMPYLKSLRIWNSGKAARDIRINAMHLRVLHLRHCAPPDGSYPNLQHVVIKAIDRLTCSYSTIIDFLVAASNISDLILEGEVHRDHLFDVSSKRTIDMLHLFHLRVQAHRDDSVLMNILNNIQAPNMERFEWYPIAALPVSVAGTLSTTISIVAVLTNQPNIWSGATSIRRRKLILNRWPRRVGGEVELRLFKPTALYVDSHDTVYHMQHLADLGRCFPCIDIVNILIPLGGFGSFDDVVHLLRNLCAAGIIVNVFDSRVAPHTYPYSFPRDVNVLQGSWDLIL